MSKIHLMAFVLVTCAACGSCGSRRGAQAPIHSIYGNSVEVWVQSGGILPIYPHDTSYYLLGSAGLKYEICIGNRMDRRIEAVVSVDGRDSVSGRPADFRMDRGYVLLAGEQMCVEGFRRNLNEVAAFEFTARDASYAARMGDDTNVGVIGVAVFDEDPGAPPLVIAGSEESEAASPPSAAEDRAAVRAVDKSESSAIGTAYGGSVSSEAEIVPFKRHSPDSPFELISLYYNDREGLEDMGIDVSDDGYTPADDRNPNPFPGAGRDAAYAPPPPVSPAPPPESSAPTPPSP